MFIEGANSAEDHSGVVETPRFGHVIDDQITPHRLMGEQPVTIARIMIREGNSAIVNEFRCRICIPRRQV